MPAVLSDTVGLREGRGWGSPVGSGGTTEARGTAPATGHLGTSPAPLLGLSFRTLRVEMLRARSQGKKAEKTPARAPETVLGYVIAHSDREAWALRGASPGPQEGGLQLSPPSPEPPAQPPLQLAFLDPPGPAAGVPPTKHTSSLKSDKPPAPSLNQPHPPGI